MVLSPPAFAGDRPPAPAFPYLPPAALAIAALEPAGCRWPLGEPGEAGFGFCAAARMWRGSYCPLHSEQARAGAGRRGARR